MKYLLDTNTCIRFLNRRSQSIINKIASLQPDDIVVCSVVKAEMYTGAAKSQNPQGTLAKQQRFLNRFVSLSFDDAAAVEYGKMRGHLEKQGTPIGPNDMLIASIALANQCILVTANVREFGRVPGLTVESWDTST